MSIQLLSLVIINSISSIILFKYTYTYIYDKISKEKNEQVTWLSCKITKLQIELDTIQDRLVEKENKLLESINKIDKFIVSNYDTI